MPRVNPQRLLATFLARIGDIYRRAEAVQGDQNLTIRAAYVFVNGLRSDATGAHAALLALQDHYNNAQIKSGLARTLEPAPADVGAAYVLLRQKVNATLDAFGLECVGAMGEAYTWSGGSRELVPVVLDRAQFSGFFAQVDALKAAAEPFVSGA